MARGHHVVMFCQENYETLVKSQGFGFENSFGLEEKAMLADQVRSRKGFGKLKQFHASLSAKIMGWYNAIASQVNAETVIVTDPFSSIIARFINEQYGTPYVSACFMPASLFSIANPPVMKETRVYRKMPYPFRRLSFSMMRTLLLDPVIGSFFNGIMRELNRDKRDFSFIKWVYASPNMLGLFPEWYGPAAKDWPAQLVRTGFPLFKGNPDERKSVALDEFLSAGDAPVIFTPGSRSSKKNGDFFASAISALEHLGLRGIFLARSSEQMPPLPDTIHYEKYVPLSLVLPHAKAMVHHGGIGTTAQALAAGTPQLFVPGNFDQFDNAHIVENLGCGIELKQAGSKALEDSLNGLLTSQEIKLNCLRVRDRMEPGSVACGRAADIIEGALREKRAAA
jgi:rhamnosyltransferase subunit B